jgi:hypothetical protein
MKKTNYKKQTSSEESVAKSISCIPFVFLNTDFIFPNIVDVLLLECTIEGFAYDGVVIGVFVP